VSSYLDLGALRTVALVALIGGCGITALFAVAVRSLAAAEQGGRGTAARRAVAAGCLTVVLAAVALGVWAVLAK
jgi:hypothetical protein